MGKSDDSIAKRKNKKIRRKQNESSKVSSRVACIIAAKKRRQSGKRRMCEGMCFSLPTPEDPFNERNGKPNPLTIRKLVKSKKDNKVDKKKVATDKKTENLRIELLGKGKNPKNDVNRPTRNGITDDAEDMDVFEKNADCPSKFLMLCLRTIQDALSHDGALHAHSWGIEFWKHYMSGNDIMATNQSHSRLDQIAWIASTAADSIAKQKKGGLSWTSPFLLYLVPSQEKAVQVRQLFKTLKTHGIHTISLHAGASVEHQCQGLKSCDPEFLVATPERLQELISRRAIDISEVSLLVVDGPDYEVGSIAAIKEIKQFISGRSQTVVFCDSSNNPYFSVLQKLLQDSFCKIPWLHET
ncbi:unnamed protein product [Cuscuta epithymum]|uniref:DEAD/DEAH-box helicase domain-containing protein n=1 Tax=Cuscuta epithymum TaxID=186058 RepID=A0AAV0E9R7_9ASTE|nr:unnamed protein product [Cuscuta epithymum]